MCFHKIKKIALKNKKKAKKFEKLKFIPLCTQFNYILTTEVLQLSITEELWLRIKKEPLPETMVLLGKMPDVPADNIFAHEKNKFGSNHCCQYQKAPIL